MDLLSAHEIYVNVCMNSFIIDKEALWSAVGLNKNEHPKYKSNVECLLYLHFRDNWLFYSCGIERAEELFKNQAKLQSVAG